MRISYRTGRALLMLAVTSGMLCHASTAENGKLTSDFQASWKFYGDHPVHQ
jgi:hypothetical protein